MITTKWDVLFGETAGSQTSLAAVHSRIMTAKPIETPLAKPFWR